MYFSRTPSFAFTALQWAPMGRMLQFFKLFRVSAFIERVYRNRIGRRYCAYFGLVLISTGICSEWKSKRPFFLPAFRDDSNQIVSFSRAHSPEFPELPGSRCLQSRKKCRFYCFRPLCVFFWHSRCQFERIPSCCTMSLSILGFSDWTLSISEIEHCQFQIFRMYLWKTF